MAREFQAGIDVADVYASALFDLARERDQVDAVRDELDELARLVAEDPTIGAFFDSSAIDDEDRGRSLEKTLRGRVSDIVLNTLLVMNAHGRLGLLPQLCRAFELRQQEARGQVEVTATSAVELDGEQKADVEQLARELSGRRPLVEFVVDPTVLGGLVLQIGDQRLDYSALRHLRDARERLLDRGDRGLDVAVDTEPGDAAGDDPEREQQA